MNLDLRALVLLAALLAGACGGTPREDPILRLSAVESLEQGKALLEQGKHVKARRLLNHAFEVEPNSRTGREALLLAAEAYYLDGGPDNFVKCEAKYRDFLNRFPTSERADYAQFQVGNCLAGRMTKPDRDQQVTHKALDAYYELIRLYPTSEYTDDARGKIVEVRNHLASAELMVGKFYFRYGLCRGSMQRLEPVLDDYPTFPRTDEVLYWLGLAYRQCGNDDKADATYRRLAEEYPQSPFLDDLEKRDEKLRKKIAKRRANIEEQKP